MRVVEGEGRTKAELAVHIIDWRKLNQFLRYCLQEDDIHLERQVANKGRTDITVNKNKPFILSFNSNTEMLKLKCHYGAWNTEDVPQHI